ncbi:MAG: HDOD domain-containing protein, partial [Planctomycetota bacterium]|nr:HDOD domain-containing protein [Planctomycetota bacterium]
MTSPILERISTSDDLPSLPTVAVEVLRLTRNPDTRLEQISSVIEHDPAIAARMLKVVNSPLFGLSRQITSINQAIALLGLRTVKVMALSFSLVDMTKRDVCEGFDYESYWKRSVTAAVAARLFASAASLRCGEEAFVGSLLADIGTLVAFRSAPDLYRPVLDRFREDGGELHVIEQEMLGATHARIGAKLLGDWGLPESLCKAVACHHGEGMAKPEGAPGLTDAVYCAALIAGVFCEDVASAELMNVKNVIIARLSLSPSELGEALEKLDAHVRETASLLSVQIGQTRDYGDIQREAAAELSHLSLQAEVDRAEASRREAVAREEAKRLNEEKRAILALASQDKLTRLANRAAFDERLEEEIARARQT